MKKYDFFGALREVAGTGTKIRHNGYRSRWGWCCYETEHRGKSVLKITPHLSWWPTVYEQKEKAWEVEKKPSKWLFKGYGLQNFSHGDLLIEGKAGEIIRQGALNTNNPMPKEIFEKMPEWFEEIKEEEEEEPEKIYLWGVCDEDGDSMIFRNKPTYKKDIGLSSKSWVETKAGGVKLLNIFGIFQKDTPKEFELVPVEED